MYVDMERYCARNPGTFLFNRPLYSDGSDCPSAIEYGVLGPDGTLHVRCFGIKQFDLLYSLISTALAKPSSRAIRALSD